MLRFRMVAAVLTAAWFAAPALAQEAGTADLPQAGAQSGAAGQVIRSAFTSAVLGREPVDSILGLGNDESHVYYFTELRGMAGTRVVHRWEYAGEVMAEVEFEVKGWRWRVWSRKSLMPQWTGQWTVSVLDQDGHVLARDRLSYTPAAARLQRDAGAVVLVGAPAR